MTTPYDIFQYNFGKSIGLLNLLKMKHSIRNLVDEFPCPPIFIEMKNQMIKLIDNGTIITDTGLYEQCIVTSMTAMEVYLTDVFNEIPKIKPPNGNPSFQNMTLANNTFNSCCNLEIFKDIQIQIDLSFLMEIRHIIIHNGGEIDQKFVDKCSREIKDDYNCFNSKYVKDSSEFKNGGHLNNYFFSVEMIDTVHRDVGNFIDYVHSKTRL